MRPAGQNPTTLPSSALPTRPSRDEGEGTLAAGALGSRVAVWIAVALAGALLAAALLLWARYGATVFFDTLSAGIAACM